MVDNLTNNEGVNIVILTLSLVLSILVAASRVESKAHKVSEIVVSACIGIILILFIYGITLGVMQAL